MATDIVTRFQLLDELKGAAGVPIRVSHFEGRVVIETPDDSKYRRESRYFWMSFAGIMYSHRVAFPCEAISCTIFFKRAGRALPPTVLERIKKLFKMNVPERREYDRVAVEIERPSFAHMDLRCVLEDQMISLLVSSQESERLRRLYDISFEEIIDWPFAGKFKLIVSPEKISTMVMSEESLDRLQRLVP